MMQSRDYFEQRRKVLSDFYKDGFTNMLAIQQAWTEAWFDGAKHSMLHMTDMLRQGSETITREVDNAAQEMRRAGNRADEQEERHESRERRGENGGEHRSQHR